MQHRQDTIARIVKFLAKLTGLPLEWSKQHQEIHTSPCYITFTDQVNARSEQLSGAQL